MVNVDAVSAVIWDGKESQNSCGIFVGSLMPSYSVSKDWLVLFFFTSSSSSLKSKHWRRKSLLPTASWWVIFQEEPFSSLLCQVGVEVVFVGPVPI